MSHTLPELKRELTNWCQSYVTAFSAYDTAGIVKHWAFPALIVHEGARTVFKSEEHFEKNTAALLAFYERQGVEQAVRKLISCTDMGRRNAAIVVEDVMLNAHGEAIVSWQAAYTLQRIDDEWKAIGAVSDGEAEAWKAMGVPLGS